MRFSNFLFTEKSAVLQSDANVIFYDIFPLSSNLHSNLGKFQTLYVMNSRSCQDWYEKTKKLFSKIQKHNISLIFLHIRQFLSLFPFHDYARSSGTVNRTTKTLVHFLTKNAW